MRVGENDPVFWYGSGTLRAYPTGETIAIVEGFDVARKATKAEAPDKVFQLSRKIFVFRHPVTGEVMKEFNGEPVHQILFPYQAIEYSLHGDRLHCAVEQGRKPRFQRFEFRTNMSAKWLPSDAAQYTISLFFNEPLPDGDTYEAFETYDYVIQSNDVASAARYHMTWLRFGDVPPFHNEEPVIIQMTARRVDCFDSLPDAIKAYVLDEAPMFVEPPRDFAEIESLQAAE
eukprot:TRINITY_DN16937_c0_g1_i1.p1 TRINITY_DN16937_c0_g1~~TRINITY_DN16937_c0_g1_i1.p1  ORF type:complete len:268 (-),score=44.20 TRINITY_DN16937_c0_g1_i1:200-889(-)